MGRLLGVTVYIQGMHTTIDFEKIEIVDDNNPYLALLGIDWEFDNFAIINLNKGHIIFEGKNIRVIVPLYSSKGVRYIEPIIEEYFVSHIDQTYQIVAKEEDWVNPTTKGKLSWEHDSSCTSDSNVGLENW